MAAVSLVLVLLGVAAALNLAAERLSVPHPVLLVLGGLALAFVPALPRVDVDPEILFLIFVPPLIYRAAITTSWRDFRLHLRSILLLAVGLVLATIALVALVAHAVVPGLAWGTAIVLGAIVAPSDPIAATAVTRRLDTPRTIDTILSGEGLVNDATALVAYRMSVRAVESGSLDILTAIPRFLLVAAGGVVVGLAVGVGIAWLRRHMTHVPEIENTISLLTPFAAFIPADRLGLSGILAVVAVGLYLGREAPRIVSPETRIQASNVWDMTVFVLEGLIFIFVGLDLPVVTHNIGQASLAQLATAGVLISLAAIAVRTAWIFLTAYLPPRFALWRGEREDTHIPSWRNVLFVSWAGMRGADSLVIALALPLMAAGAAFPARDVIVFITFVVILVSLLVQGGTVQPMIHWLGLTGDSAAVDREEVTARLRTVEAGLHRLDEITSANPQLAASASELQTRQRRRISRYRRGRLDDGNRDEDHGTSISRLRAEMIAAERQTLVTLRDDGTIGDDVMRRIQHDLDLEQMLVGTSDETLEERAANVRTDGLPGV